VAVISIIPVTVNRIIEYSTLINTDAEFNVIITDVVDRAGLAIRTRIKIKTSLYSKHISRFLGMVENMLISVDSIVYRVNIFVTRSASQSLILEIPYLHSARAQLLFNDDSM